MGLVGMRGWGMGWTFEERGNDFGFGSKLDVGSVAS